MEIDTFSLTTAAIAHAVPCDPGIVRLYADMGWLECRRLSNGVRLLKPSAVEKVRKLRAERLARRGGSHKAKPAA